MTYEVRAGVLFIDGVRAMFPRDTNSFPVSPIASIDATGNFVPVPLIPQEVDWTETPLGASPATYSSGAIDISNFGKVTYSVYSDVNGSLTISFGRDGTNWDVVKTVAVTGTTGADGSYDVSGKYVKIEFAIVAGTSAILRMGLRGKLI